MRILYRLFLVATVTAAAGFMAGCSSVDIPDSYNYDAHPLSGLSKDENFRKSGEREPASLTGRTVPIVLSENAQRATEALQVYASYSSLSGGYSPAELARLAMEPIRKSGASPTLVNDLNEAVLAARRSSSYIVLLDTPYASAQASGFTFPVKWSYRLYLLDRSGALIKSWSGSASADCAVVPISASTKCVFGTLQTAIDRSGALSDQVRRQ